MINFKDYLIFQIIAQLAVHFIISVVTIINLIEKFFKK